MAQKKGQTKEPTKGKHPGGRPKKEIDQAQFEELCHIQCTEMEICAVLNVDDNTLARWCEETYQKSFSEVFREKREGGKASLRRAQWKLATEGMNPSMQIFLGKNMLKQTDKPKEEDNSIENILRNIQTIAEVMKNTAPNRKIDDFE